MDDIQRSEWEALKAQGRSLIYDAYHTDQRGVECLLRLIVDPSFDTVENWRIFRRNTAIPHSYFAAWTLWHQERDLEKVLATTGETALQRWVHGRALSPTIETGEAELPTEAAEEFLSRLSGLSVPCYAPADGFGLDGVTYHLKTGGLFAGVEYFWWESPPGPWLPLQGAVVAMRDLIGHAATDATR